MADGLSVLLRAARGLNGTGAGVRPTLDMPLARPANARSPWRADLQGAGRRELSSGKPPVDPAAQRIAGFQHARIGQPLRAVFAEEAMNGEKALAVIGDP